MTIDRIIDTNAALGAYANTANVAARGRVDGGDETGESGDSSGGISFSDYLKDKTRESINTMKTGETMSAKAITGEADLTDVVQAVTDAELTLQTVVAVRDRMISAYQEIMRMPI